MKLSNFILQLFLIFIVIPVAVAQNLNKYSENILIAKRYYENSEYRKAAQSYSRAFASNNNLGRADHRYEAARCWGIAGEIDSAFYQLDRCAKARFSEYLKMSTDSAFEKLHGDIRWPKILEIIAMNKKRADEHYALQKKNLNQPLILILDTIYLDDQTTRMRLVETERKYGDSSLEMKSQLQLMSVKDSINKVKIVRILDKFGWLGPEVIGNQGSNTLFLVVQHLDLETQLRYLPLLMEAVKNKKAMPSQLALLEDRIAVRQGKQQVYGTQIGKNPKTGKYYVLPMLSPEQVDSRRLKVGLPPIEEYVRDFGIDWSIENYKKLLEVVQ